MLFRLSYALDRRTAGLEPATLGAKKEPPPVQQADSNIKVRDNCRGISGLRGQDSSQRSGRRDSNSQPPASDAGALPNLRFVQSVLTAGFEPALTAV
jgi:hypothetical protein